MITKISLFKSYITVGLALLIVGFIFDFLFVQWKASDAFKLSNPAVYLNSFHKLMFDLVKFYIIVLGFLLIIFALLALNTIFLPKLDWTIFGLLVGGSILLIASGFWYANTGPSFRWEPKCYVLTAGLLAVVGGLGLEIYKILGAKNFS